MELWSPAHHLLTTRPHQNLVKGPRARTEWWETKDVAKKQDKARFSRIREGEPQVAILRWFEVRQKLNAHSPRLEFTCRAPTSRQCIPLGNEADRDSASNPQAATGGTMFGPPSPQPSNCPANGLRIGAGTAEISGGPCNCPVKLRPPEPSPALRIALRPMSVLADLVSRRG
jgi:hypothetical protein